MIIGPAAPGEPAAAVIARVITATRDRPVDPEVMERLRQLLPLAQPQAVEEAARRLGRAS